MDQVRWLTVQHVADLYGVSTWWVYDNKARIGFVRLSDKPRGGIRFDARAVEAFMVKRSQGATEKPKRSRVTRQTTWRIAA